MARGIKPLSTYFSGPPVIVNVLPDPVCPYASIVPLYPSIPPRMTSRATLSNTCMHDMPRLEIWDRRAVGLLLYVLQINHHQPLNQLQSLSHWGKGYPRDSWRRHNTSSSTHKREKRGWDVRCKSYFKHFGNAELDAIVRSPHFCALK